MTKPIIFDGENTREMNDDELAQWELDKIEGEAQAQAQADRQALKTATLAKLGLTADEVAALLS
jgi:hypothetical protein